MLWCVFWEADGAIQLDTLSLSFFRQITTNVSELSSLTHFLLNPVFREGLLGSGIIYILKSQRTCKFTMLIISQLGQIVKHYLTG